MIFQFLNRYSNVLLKVKVHIYSPDIPDSSADFTLYLPRYWNSLCNGLILYPLLLGGQRQCGFKPCPGILYRTDVLGIEPQTSRSQVQHCTTQPCTPTFINSCINGNGVFNLVVKLASDMLKRKCYL